MNLFDLTFMAIGGIIGAGIFTMVGSGISATGRSVTLALIVGMLFQMSQQVRYVFTSAMFQVSGGMYSQDALVLTPLLTGVAGTAMFISSLNWSAFGISIASYLGDLIPVLKDHQLITAALALLVFFIISVLAAQPHPAAGHRLGGYDHHCLYLPLPADEERQGQDRLHRRYVRCQITDIPE